MPHHLDRGDPGDDLLRQLDLGRGGGAVAGPAGGRFGDGGDDRGLRVPEDQRAPGADPVEVAVAVDIDQLAALAALDEDRVAADLAHRADRRVDAAGKNAERAVVELRRTLETRNARPPRPRNHR